MRQYIIRMLYLLACIFLLQCSSLQEVHISYEHPIPSDSLVLLAGASKVDITPPPGMPLAGYSSNAHFAQGFRTRLYARVIYLKSGNNAIALIQCDLLSGSSLVQKKIAQLVSKTTDLSYEGIMMAGTHTHSGPGNYFESNFYNRFASNAAGFDHEYFNFLCNQIATAIMKAYSSRKPAKIAYGAKALYGFTRNRSLNAFTANSNAPTNNPLKAVNPIMHMLRVDSIDEGKQKPLAAFTVYSIHGTTIPNTNTLYSGDVFAYIERELEWEIQRQGISGFVHAVCNGTHADCAPNIPKGRQGFEEAKRLGILLGQQSIILYNELQSHFTLHVNIKSILREIDAYKEPTLYAVSLCTPKVGNTLLAGASDGGPTPVVSSMPFFKEGSKSCMPIGCQKQKIITGGPLQPLILPKNDFPHNLTFQAIRINNILLLPVPFEVTFESGNRIAKAAAQSHQALTPIVISCANGYTGYCTTPEEYSMQHYEGGHTLYGPNTQPYLALQYAELTKSMNTYIGDSNWIKNYSLKSNSFMKKYPMPAVCKRKAVTQPQYIVNPGVDESYVLFRWEDIPPDRLEFHKPLVTIEYSSEMDNKFMIFTQNGIPVDDTGYDIAVIFTGSITKEGMAIYETRWYNPPLNARYRFRFVIQPRENINTLVSEPFSW
ncbi:MAG: neutral/alkaline non-lysosomal ceramidase N-terminal domain-containing protein [Spirochaetes bacterium]|nr:neutral/alkaline non-lysosomal ceramidase N-terminal domain-containing protein [Spirochaetota bacterium]